MNFYLGSGGAGGDAQNVTTECDTLAAVVYDLKSDAQPVAWHTMDAQAAFAACETAVAKYPESQRLRLLKARTLLKLEQAEEAQAMLEALDAEGYSAATYLLG